MELPQDQNNPSIFLGVLLLSLYSQLRVCRMPAFLDQKLQGEAKEVATPLKQYFLNHQSVIEQSFTGNVVQILAQARILTE